jgi:dipeptide transport system substrate-binding protein
MPVFCAFSACKKSNQNEFVYCSEGAPSTFNPQLAADGTTFDASSQPIYDRLLSLSPDGSKLEPALASSWSVSENEREILFELRPGVQFHSNESFKPSRPLNADDVVFTFKKMMNSANPFHVSDSRAYLYFESTGMKSVLLDVVKVSDLKVKFILSRPDAPFLANLAMDFASILSKEYGDLVLKDGRLEDINKKPIGTGPFAFESYEEGKSIKYTAHDQYYRGKQKMNTLVFEITPDPKERLKKLDEGSCHFAKDLPYFRGSTEKVNVIKTNGHNVSYIGLNLKNKKFQNKKLRLAMSKALDRESYIDRIYNGAAQKAKTLLPPSNWAYSEDLKELTYDLEEARNLIADSGIDLPMQVTLWTLPVSRPYNPDGRVMGEMIKEDLRKIGIDVELVTFDWPTYLRNIKAGGYELVEYGWSADSRDPDNFLHTLLSCSGSNGGANLSNFCHQKYERLVTEAKKTFDQKKRKALYQKAMSLFQEEMPVLPIAHSSIFRVLNRDVRGYEPRPLGTESFFRVELSSWN